MYNRKPTAADSANYVTAMCRKSIVRGDLNKRFHLPQFYPVGPVVQRTVNVPTFYARKKKVKQEESEEDIFGFTMADKIRMRKEEKELGDIEDYKVFYMERKLGRKLKKGEYVIQISSDARDVRIVNSLSEQRQWGTSIVDGGLRIFDKYKVILDPDGIYAKVELDPGSLLVARCANCCKLIEIDEIRKMNKNYFCNMQCKREYKEKDKQHAQLIQGRIKQGNIESVNRIHELQDQIGAKFNNAVLF